MGTKADRAHKGAGWVALVVALVGVAENYLERDTARYEARTAAAQAAAFAKVEVEDDMDERMGTLTTTVAVMLERDRWTVRTIDALRSRIETLEKRRGRRRSAAGHVHAPTSFALPDHSVIQPSKPKRKPKNERIEEQKEIYLKEAF